MHDKWWVIGHIWKCECVYISGTHQKKAHIEFYPEYICIFYNVDLTDKREICIFLKYVLGHVSAHQVHIK